MYHWIEDNEYLARVKSTCSDVINQLVQLINAERKMKVKQHLVGSGARNLIVQNGQKAIDLDYNLEILDFGIFREHNCREIKNYIIDKFKEILNKFGWGYQDSTSAITTKEVCFKEGNPTPFKIDLCITYRSESNGRSNRLIHEKTGIVSKDRYYWNEAFCSEGLENKVEWLKNEPKIWNEIRDTYLEKKNMYLHRNDHDHPSFIVYIETINEIYDRHNKRCRCHNDKGYDIRNKEPQGKVLTYNEVSNKVKNVRI